MKTKNFNFWGYCFVWSQLEGKRGSNEIATCPLKVLKLLIEDDINEFFFYSYSCGGQNQNRFIYSMWEYAARIEGKNHSSLSRHTKQR